MNRQALLGSAFGLALTLSTLAPAPARAAGADTLLSTNVVAEVAERVTPAVVNITTQRTRGLPGQGGAGPANGRHPFEDFFNFPPGMPQGGPRREVGAGSGVVVSADGYIVTNNHVIEGADQIKVTFADRREFRAKLIGTDKASDVALIKIEGSNLPHLSFGDSTALRLGEFVLAVGNPFGVGQTVTLGIVSAKGRANIGIVDYEDFIQTDAAINPGNSGGALVSLKGELVGINTAILSRGGGANGIGFAVPTSMVKPILDQIREYGRVRRGFLGVAIQDLTPELATSMSLDKVEGVLVNDVMQDGPARNELKEGDIIVSVNGAGTRSAVQLRNAIALLGPGGKANLVVLRDGKKRDVMINLTEKKEDNGPASPKQGEETLLSGLTLRDLADDLRDRLKTPAKLKGVVVTEVEPGSPAEEAGLAEGDVITRVNRHDVGSVAELKKQGIEAQKRVLLRVWRDGHYFFIVLHK